MRRALVLVALLAALAPCRATIHWKNCEGIADHPSVATGNFHNLCIKKHVFEGESLTWWITKTDLSDVKFNKCTFKNSLAGLTNFTGSQFNHVEFNDCSFSSFIKNPMRLENVQFNNVEFNGCIFDKSAALSFAEFGMNNVTFTNCRFESDTLFTKGRMQKVTFQGCSFKRSAEAGTVSGNDALRFSSVVVRETGFVKSEFINPIIFQWVNGADMFFNHTNFGEFWCHDRPDRGRDAQFFSSFNDSIFQDTTFRQKVYCDQTSWNGFANFNGSFLSNADFSGSEIQDLWWDEVYMSSTFKGQCNTLDFSGTKLFRRHFWNVTVECELDMRKAEIEIVNIQTLRAKKSKFEGTIFKEQEYVDNRCCMNVCRALKCKCDIKEPSACPTTGYPVDINAPWLCFPAAAVADTIDGAVRMDALEHGHRVANGEGGHSEVFFFGHRSAHESAPFVEVAHSGAESPLRISPDHYVHANGRLVAAGALKAGDTLRGADGYQRVVLGTKSVRMQGIYAPATLHGDMIVDGVAVSSYTRALHPRVAHKLLAPVRLMHRVGLGRVVRAVSAFDTRSWAHIPRALGIPAGPREVEV